MGHIRIPENVQEGKLTRKMMIQLSTSSSLILLSLSFGLFVTASTDWLTVAPLITAGLLTLTALAAPFIKRSTKTIGGTEVLEARHRVVELLEWPMTLLHTVFQLYFWKSQLPKTAERQA